MGCQACKGVEKNHEEVLRDILKCIQNENVSSLHFFLKNYVRHSKEHHSIKMNERTITLGSYKLNFMAYALAAGTVKSFKFLYEKCGCSLEQMNQNFAEYAMDPLNIVCEKGHLELLKYYLPLYFSHRQSTQEVTEMTLDFHTTHVFKEPRDSFTPMQIACMNGNISIVDYLFQYNQSFPSPLLSVNDINEETGENCALISVKSGNLAMVKMIYEKYNLNFRTKNKCGETALQICAVCSSKFPNIPYSEVFMYLVEVVGLDLTDNHEEILLVLENKDLVVYTEAILNSKGINTSKKEVDEMFKTKRRIHTNSIAKNEETPAKNNDDDSSCISSIERASYETPFHVGSLLTEHKA